MTIVNGKRFCRRQRADHMCAEQLILYTARRIHLHRAFFRFVQL